MAYNNAIPASTDIISQSQADILNNFIAISNAFNLNHGNFNSALQGMHNFMQMPIQTSAPTQNAAQTNLYTATSTLTAQPELFFIKQTGSTAPAPVNAAAGYEITAAQYATTGWTRLASGILIKWGNVTPSATGTTTVTYPVAATIPVFQNVYNVQLTSFTTGGGAISPVSMINNGTASFQFANSTTVPVSVFYYSIGV